MAALTVISTAQVAVVFVGQCRIRTYLVAPGGIKAGQGVYVTAAGQVAPMNTATAGHEQFRGIALETSGPGQGVDVLEEGFIAGFDLSALVPYDALDLRPGHRRGARDRTPGTKSVPVGRVVADEPTATR